MPSPKPTISRTEFDALAKVSGLQLTDDQRSEFFAVYGYVEQIAERLRIGGKRPREAEPALTFKPTRS